MSKHGGDVTLDEWHRSEEPNEAEGYEPEPDYDLVYPRIARTLERLCADCGFNNVLAVFSGDMPCHRHERERLERESARLKRRA
jgi:hypothetical protein